MKIQPLLLVLTILNALLLVILLTKPPAATAQEATSVLRAHSLEIVDEHGRVRAAIRVFPADPKVVMPDGTKGYPETVLLRLINSKGRPNMKIAAMEDGSGINLGGEADPADIQLLARGSSTFAKLTNKKGKQQLVKP